MTGWKAVYIAMIIRLALCVIQDTPQIKLHRNVQFVIINAKLVKTQLISAWIALKIIIFLIINVKLVEIGWKAVYNAMIIRYAKFVNKVII